MALLPDKVLISISDVCASPSFISTLPLFVNVITSDVFGSTNLFDISMLRTDCSVESYSEGLGVWAGEGI